MEQNQHAKRILGRIHDNTQSTSRRPDLIFSRVPQKTRDAFILLANKEFCGDYGMLLKWLMDGIPSETMEEILNRMDELEMRMNDIESTPRNEEEDTEPKRRMLDGTVRRKRNDE